MIRWMLLYSPAAVCAGWAVLIWEFGRTDGLVIAGCMALAVALVLHTWQGLSDHYERWGDW